MQTYSDAAVAKMLEAEALLTKAMELREEAMAMFARANELAFEFAKAKAADVQDPDQGEDICW